ncbi:hypothetical protein [Dyella koreensis]|uniref:Uncharacterized protein n=1 Tax=Dyella koreensis TaxID=311235 RepID=A0ABW8K7P7_9GAMM
MKQSTASNLALLLAPLGWGFAFIGVTAQLGDPDPDIPAAVLEAERLKYMVVFYLGVFLIAGALWASGYSFSEAKRRAVVAAFIGVAPLIALVVGSLIF